MGENVASSVIVGAAFLYAAVTQIASSSGRIRIFLWVHGCVRRLLVFVVFHVFILSVALVALTIAMSGGADLDMESALAYGPILFVGALWDIIHGRCQLG